MSGDGDAGQRLNAVIGEELRWIIARGGDGAVLLSSHVRVVAGADFIVLEVPHRVPAGRGLWRLEHELRQLRGRHGIDGVALQTLVPVEGGRSGYASLTVGPTQIPVIKAFALKLAGALQGIDALVDAELAFDD